MIEYRPSGEALSPDRDYNKPRNVWRKNRPRMKHASSVGVVLELFTVPIDVLFRRNFGQRWFTFANFLGGLFVLVIFVGMEWLIAAFAHSLCYYWLKGFVTGVSNGHYSLPSSDHGFSLMPWILLAYVLRSLYHFSMMWWRNRTHSAVHSFYDGSSFFEPIAICVMWLINMLALPFAYGFSVLMPRSQRKRSKSAPLLVNNISAFTDTIIDPIVLIWLALLLHGTVSAWLLISAIAMVVHARKKHIIRRNQFLDFRDASIEAELMRTYHYGKEEAAQTATQKSRKARPAVKQKPQIMNQASPPYQDLDHIIDAFRNEMQNNSTP